MELPACCDNLYNSFAKKKWSTPTSTVLLYNLISVNLMVKGREMTHVLNYFHFSLNLHFKNERMASPKF
jgi:hypothetical protein